MTTTISAKLIKITVNVGVGKLRNDAKQMSLVEGNLAKITGQKPVPRRAARAIAGFKLKQGEVVGYLVTLRGKRMQDFLRRLIKLALPANRDFRGIKQSSIDQSGNLTIGIRDMTTFPELHDQAGSFSQGLEITLVADTPLDQAKQHYEQLGIPFAKE